MLLEIKDSATPKKYGIYNYAAFWLVKHKQKTIGITGLYTYDQYSEDVFMNWYGVVPDARNMGFGQQIFNWTVKLAQSKNFKYFRLYTELGDNNAAIALYRKVGMFEESYLREPGVRNMVVFSLNLTNRPVTKWNNRYLGIQDSYLLYSENVWEEIKANPLGSLASILRHPTIVWRLIFSR